MKTSFYASGFLYCPKHNQILLLKSEIWSTIGGESKEGEDPQTTFQRIINRLLHLDLKTKHIYPVYDYFHEGLNKDNFVFYAEIKTCKKFESPNGAIPTWVSFDEISKLAFAPRAKQDVVVGERVINAKWRDNEVLKQNAIITDQV